MKSTSLKSTLVICLCIGDKVFRMACFFSEIDCEILFWTLRHPNCIFSLTILHIDKHITRVDFSEVDFIVNLDGNVLEAVNL